MKRSAVKERAQGPPASPEDPETGGGGSGWRLLTVARDRITAYLLDGRLSQLGIETFFDLSNSRSGAFLKPFGDDLAPVKVYVRQHQFSQASLVLHEVENEPTDPIESVPRDRKNPLWPVLIVLVAATIGFIELFGFAPCVLRLFCF